MDEQSVSRSILNIRNLVVLAIFGLMIWFLVVIGRVLGIFLFSMVLAFLLYPPVEWLCRKRFPRSIAILAIYLVILAIIGLILLLIVPPLISQFRNLADYLSGTSTTSLISRISEWLSKLETGINHQFGTNIQIEELVANNKDKIQAVAVGMLNKTAIWVGNAASLITLLVSIPAITFYLLMDWPKIKISLMNFFPPHLKDSSTSLMNHLTVTLNSYLRGQFKLSCIIAIMVTAMLALMNGLGAAFPGFGFHIGPYLLLGILAGFTEVIPIVGPLIAFTPALILGFIDGPITGITVILIYAFIQFTEGNIIVPRIMGDKLDVHPLTVMFALLCGGLIGGIGGMLLALPMAAGLKAVFEQYYPTFIQRLEDLLLEKKDLNPVQSKAVNQGDS